MGISVSRAEAAPPAPVRGSSGGTLLPPTAAAIIQNAQSGKVTWAALQEAVQRRMPWHTGADALHNAQVVVEKPKQVVDYMRLPPPIKYEELQRECMSECFHQSPTPDCSS